MVKAVYLEPRRPGAKSAPKFTLPKCDPWLDGDVNVRRGAKEMDVIRHDDVSADHPSISFAPRFQQRIMNAGVRQLRFALSRADCDENDRCSIEENEYSLRWMTSLSQSRDVPRLDRVSPYQSISPR